MLLLPIVDRELRTAARRPGTYQLRAAAAVLGLALVLWIWLGERIQNVPASGPRLFSLLAGAAFALALATGPLFTADLISQERREGTLGLLFLTRLHPPHIILGKFAGAILRPTYALLALLPILSLPLLLGGVTLANTLQTVAALANTLLLSATSRLLISTICRNERLATAITTVVVLALNLTPLADHWLQPYSPNSLFFSHFSPVFALHLALSPSPAASDPALLQLTWITQHSFAWILLALACLIVPRLLHDPPLLPHQDAPWPQRLARSLNRRLSPSPPPLALTRDTAYAWLAARGHLHPCFLWSALATTALLSIASLATLQSSPALNALALAAVTLLLHGLVKAWMVSESVHRLAEDRRLGTLELLLGSRLTPAEILFTLRAHLRQRIVLPATAVLLITPLLAALLACQPQTSFGQTHLTPVP